MTPEAEGKLYLVPTPIGNLGDLTYRAVEVLQGVDLILAEDTRTSGKLLAHYGIDKPTQSFHAHNEHARLEGLVQRMAAGGTVALISDAGMPGVSDPGFLLARACAEKGLAVEALPGATAFLPALLQSGLPMDRFAFEGFLPHKKGRQKRMAALAAEERTLVFYESPHRLLKFLQEVVDHMGGERPVAVVRELTKLHEETWRSTAAEAVAEFSQRAAVKGEIVVVVGGA